MFIVLQSYMTPNRVAYLKLKKWLFCLFLDAFSSSATLNPLHVTRFSPKIKKLCVCITQISD